MTDLNNGLDEMLDRLPPMNPAAEYKHDIWHLKSRYRYDTITLYTSSEFRLLRARLIRIVGEANANDIMNDNL